MKKIRKPLFFFIGTLISMPILLLWNSLLQVISITIAVNLSYGFLCLLIYIFYREEDNI